MATDCMPQAGAELMGNGVYLNLQASDCGLIGILHCLQRQVLINFQALLAGVSRNELDLGVGQPSRRQVGEHLVPEKMRMHVLRNSRTASVFLDDCCMRRGVNGPQRRVSKR